MGRMELGQRKDLERFYSHVTKYKSLKRVKRESGALTTECTTMTTFDRYE